MHCLFELVFALAALLDEYLRKAGRGSTVDLCTRAAMGEEALTRKLASGL
jgi:hypothetical protein